MGEFPCCTDLERRGLVAVSPIWLFPGVMSPGLFMDELPMSFPQHHIRGSQPQTIHQVFIKQNCDKILELQAEWRRIWFVVVFQLLSHVQRFVTPWTAVCQASLSFTISWSLLKLMPMNRWCHPTISSSVVPFSFLQSLPAYLCPDFPFL